jgi:alpha-L-fucosidase 2
LFAAATESVRRRLAWWRGHGDEMAFGLVQLGLAAATLGLADEAYEALCRLATTYWRANLVSTHNAGAIFNTDICGGLPALVTAMLVSSRGDQIRLLPARPRAWVDGSIHGVLLRGGRQVRRLSWSDDRVEADIWCRDDEEFTVCVADQVRATVAVRAGDTHRLRFPLRPDR